MPDQSLLQPTLQVYDYLIDPTDRPVSNRRIAISPNAPLYSILLPGNVAQQAIFSAVTSGNGYWTIAGLIPNDLLLPGNSYYEYRDDWQGFAFQLTSPFKNSGATVSYTATSLTDTAANFPTAGAGLVGRSVWAFISAARGYALGIVTANTATSITVAAGWIPGDQIAATPGAQNQYVVGSPTPDGFQASALKLFAPPSFPGGASIPGPLTITGPLVVTGALTAGGLLTASAGLTIVGNVLQSGGAVALGGTAIVASAVNMPSGWSLLAAGVVALTVQSAGNRLQAPFGLDVAATAGTLNVVAGGLTIQLGGVTINAGGLSVTGGATINTGGLTITLGGITINAGGLTMAGLLTMSDATSRIVPGVTSFAVRNNANAADNLLVQDSGAITTRGPITSPPSPGGTIPPVGAGGTAWELIDSQTLGANAANIRIPASGSLPTGFRHLRFIYALRDTGAGTGQDLVLFQINGDALARYGSEGFNASAAAFTNFEQLAGASATGGQWARMAQGGAGAGNFGSGWVELYNYNLTDRLHMVHGQAFVVQAANLFFSQMSGYYTQLVAITFVTFIPNANQFVTGSSIQTYGIPGP